MFENILHELRIKFETFQTLVVTNSITNELGQRRINELMFASNIVKSSLIKNKTEFSEAQLIKIKSFQDDIKEFISKFPIFHIEDEEHEKMLDEFRTEFAKKIRRRNILNAIKPTEQQTENQNV